MQIQKQMFESSTNHKKQDKICSISNFSSESNYDYMAEQEINQKVQNLFKQQKKNNTKTYQKPVFIISQNFKSKHITALTQVLEKNQVPIQFQHETDSLGQQLNTTFFVVVDNKNGSLSLGKEFNSVLMTIIGYPKIGSNKQNIYCQQPQQVVEQYNEFVMYKTNKPTQTLESKLSRLNGQQSMLRSGSNAFSILNSQVSGIRLKSISKYDKKKRETSQGKSSTRKFLASDIFKSESWENKQNLTSIRDIYQHIKTLHHLYLLESLQNQTYNNLISQYYYDLKLSTASKPQESIFYYRSPQELVTKLGQVQKNISSKTSKGEKPRKEGSIDPNNTNSPQLHFVLVSYEAALKLATGIFSEFYAIRDRVRFIVAMFKQNESKVEQLQKQMLLVKKTIHSNLFQSLACSPEQCEKALKAVGFHLKSQNSTIAIKVTPHDCKSILTKSNKNINNTDKLIRNTHNDDDMVSFCPPKLKNTVSINQSENYSKISPSKKQENERETQVNFLLNSELPVQQKSDIKSVNTSPRSKIVIPPINSMLSPQKSSVSSKGSKIKIIKVIKKQPSALQPSQMQEKQKNIAQVNSQYCINKNISIVNKMQQKINSSRHSLSSRKNIKSIENGHDSSEQKTPRLNRIGSNSSLSSSKKAGSSKFISRKQFKQNQKNTQNSFHNQYQYPKSPQTKKVRKLKLNLNSDEPFVTRCSRITMLDDDSKQASYKNIRKLKKQTSQSRQSANDYYFGSSLGNDRKWQEQQVSSNKNNLIDGLVYVEYNQMISSIADNFKNKCPGSVINKENFRPFYLACEYSRQVKKIWRNGKQRSILPAIIDIQGLSQIYKYYSNVMYEDDQLQFYSTVEDQNSQSNSQWMQDTGKLSLPPQYSKQSSHMLLFFTIVTEKQSENPIFQKMDWISEKLPKHEMIKCIVEENMSDNEMRQKATEIYDQIFSYFQQLKEQYGDRFVQTA